MWKHKNTMKIAYIIFLILCSIYHIVADIFNLDFSSWDKIVCATTISSCIFALASSKKSQYNIVSKVIRSLSSSNNELKKIKDERSQNPEKYTNSKHDTDYLEQVIVENETQLDKMGKNKVSHLQQSFIFNIIGFLAFFCLMTFDFMYSFLEPMQDFYTLMAFIVILLTDAHEESWAYNYGNLLEKSLNLCDTEENENGKR